MNKHNTKHFIKKIPAEWSFSLRLQQQMGGENAFALANLYGEDCSGFELRWMRDIFFHTTRTDRPTQSSLQCITGRFSPGYSDRGVELIYCNVLLHTNGNTLRPSTCSIYIYVITTPCSRTLLEKLIFLQVSKIFPAFLEPESSLPCSRQHLVPILSHINPLNALQAYLLNNCFLISVYPRLCLPNYLFPWCFPIETTYKIQSSRPYVWVTFPAPFCPYRIPFLFCSFA
jgi:hypothetical protein